MSKSAKVFDKHHFAEGTISNGQKSGTGGESLTDGAFACGDCRQSVQFQSGIPPLKAQGEGINISIWRFPNGGDWSQCRRIRGRSIDRDDTV